MKFSLYSISIFLCHIDNQANILAARAVTNIMRSSLGPMGMDKMLVSKEAESDISSYEGCFNFPLGHIDQHEHVLSSFMFTPRNSFLFFVSRSPLMVMSLSRTMVRPSWKRWTSSTKSANCSSSCLNLRMMRLVTVPLVSSFLQVPSSRRHKSSWTRGQTHKQADAIPALPAPFSLFLLMRTISTDW